MGSNGQEKSTEVGESNYTAQFWGYDPHIGRRWNVDPVPQTELSDFSVLNNNPNLYIDPNGDYSRLGALWRAAFWGGTSSYYESKKSWGVTYVAKSFGAAESQYDVVTSFRDPKVLISREELTKDYLDYDENKKFWDTEINKGHVQLDDNRLHALGSWSAFAFPGGKLLYPVKEAALLYGTATFEWTCS